ncbi:MAG: NAD(P)H-dependent glycerol-3-phosphate dehydrogenase [Burkholderiaceae bacterium]|jgi:glycerol-3-phosphate dehydrogenase (NAD(P)+)
MTAVTVFGAGAWGTAFASHVAQKHDVLLWGRDASLVDSIVRTQQNARYLAGVELTPALGLTADFDRAAAHAEGGVWVLAVPLSGLRQTLDRLLALQPVERWPVLIWLCKGLEVPDGLLPHQVVAAVTGRALGGVLSGPSFAVEIAKGLPCALTVASTDSTVCAQILQIAHHGLMRVYRHTDLVGVEVGGAVKNIMAIACGISDGLGLGLNARAALITRGMAEIRRLAVALGGQTETLNGLAGFGDLLLTCTGDLSRNRRVGLMLAEGSTLDEVLQALGQVAEGVRCAAVVRDKAAALRVDMPIIRTVCDVLFENLSPTQAVTQLLARDPRPDVT